MFTKVFQIVGMSTVKTSTKSFTVYHCLGDPFYDSHTGQFVCVCFADPDSPFRVGDLVNVIRAGKNYYIVGHA